MLGDDKQQEQFMILYDNLVCTREMFKIQYVSSVPRLIVSMQIKIFRPTGQFPVNGFEEFFIVDCHLGNS